MGVNAQTTVPTFVTSQVLTADQMNQSARTGVPVFADTTARDAGFGGTGEKVLAEGQLCYLESTNVVQYYDGATWATVGPQTFSSGLTLISSTTIGTSVSSVTVSNAFSATYDNYVIAISGGTPSADDLNILLQLGSATTGTYAGGIGVGFSTGTVTGFGTNNAGTFRMGGTRTTGLIGYCVLTGPFLSNATGLLATIGLASGGINSGVQLSSTSFTAFTISLSSGTVTGGTIKVYGMANS